MGRDYTGYRGAWNHNFKGEHGRDLCGDGIVLYLDRDSGYMNLWFTSLPTWVDIIYSYTKCNQWGELSERYTRFFCNIFAVFQESIIILEYKIKSLLIFFYIPCTLKYKIKQTKKPKYIKRLDHKYENK